MDDDLKCNHYNVVDWIFYFLEATHAQTNKKKVRVDRRCLEC